MTRASGSLTAFPGFRSGPGRDFDGRVGRIPLLMSLLLIAVVTGTCAAADVAVPANEAAPDSFPVHRYFPLPFVFYQPETRFGGGVGLLHTIRTAPDGKTSNDGAFLVLTERKQFSIILSTERYVKEERYRILAEGVGARFPDYFYGIGNTTNDADEESFTAETAKGYVDLRKRVRRPQRT